MATHRLNSIALGACRRIGRSSVLARSAGGVQSSSYHPSILSVSSPPQNISHDHRLNNNRQLVNQYRQYHNTNIIQQEDVTSAAAKAKITDANGEPLAPFNSPKVEELFHKIIWLDMVEVHLLAELINEKMGITISDAERKRIESGGSIGGGGGGKKKEAAEEEVVEEKTAFDLKLTAFDAKSKIKVIKEVRAITSLGLKEAKELVEGVPATVKKDIKKEEAEELKTKLESLGATIEIV